MNEPKALRAEPDPRGCRVQLSWVNPASAGFSGVRVLRRADRVPLVPDDLGTSAEIHQDFSTGAGGDGRFTDAGLTPETTYYYAVVAFDAAGPHAAFAFSFASAPYAAADYLYRLLPEVYRLYDTVPPPPGTVAAEDAAKGQLQRFIELVASPFDLMRSAAASTRTFHDLGRVDAALLPLLAQWIGEPMNDRLDVPEQRNALRFAPHYFRTRGIAANLRAALNRLSTWDARLKEFVHNVFASNQPDDGALRECAANGVAFSASIPTNFETAPGGRAAPLAARDGRTLLFYHARATPPRARDSRELRPSDDQFHLFCKVRDAGNDLPSLRVTHGASQYTHPAAVERPEGGVWLLSTLRDASDGSPSDVRAGRIALTLVALGGPALPAKLTGAAVGPFALVDGDTLEVVLTVGAQTRSRVIVARAEHFRTIATATAEEVARLLDRELPGIDVSATSAGALELVARERGAGVSIGTPPSPLATKLGFAAGPVLGRSAFAAALTGSRAEPFAFTGGETLTVSVDGDEPRTVSFESDDFANPGAATAAEVATALNRVIAGIAGTNAGKLVLGSRAAGAASILAVDTVRSSSASLFGLGAAPPFAAASTDEDTPSGFVDGTGALWAFWASRRRVSWNVWYARLANDAWSPPKPLTAGLASNREPAAALDAGNGRIWVAFTRKKSNGKFNVFIRSTAQLDFTLLTAADWAETELGPVPAVYDNRDPALRPVAAGIIDLYFASNRANGWNVWKKRITQGSPPIQGPDLAVTYGQETQRWPAALTVAGVERLWFRSNAARELSSAVYPLTRTFDGRYAGSTSADTRNSAKLSRRRELDDIGRYTYDTNTSDTSLFARDTIGVYLTPNTEDQALVLRERQFLAGALRRFVPIQTRLVFLIDTSSHELVYTYDFPDVSPPRVIGEVAFESILPEVVPRAEDDHTDRARVRFLRTWVGDASSGTLADLAAAPPDLASRLHSSAFEEEE